MKKKARRFPIWGVGWFLVAVILATAGTFLILLGLTPTEISPTPTATEIVVVETPPPESTVFTLVDALQVPTTPP